MRKFIVITACIIGFVGFWARAQSPSGSTQRKQDEEWKLFLKEGCSIRYPSTWEMHAGHPKAHFVLMYRADTAKPFSNIVFRVFPRKKGNSLKKRIKDLEQNLTAYFPNGSFVSGSAEGKGKKRYSKIVIHLDNAQGEEKLVLEERYWITDDHEYQLMFGTNESRFETLGKEAGLIMDTFTIED